MKLRWSVFFRDSKRCWVLSYNDGSRDRQKVIPRDVARAPSDRCKRLAQAWAREFLCDQGLLSVDQAGGAHRARRRRGPTVEDLWPRWLKLRRRDRQCAATVDANESQGKLHVLPHLGDVSFERLAARPAILREWVRELRDKLAANYTRNIHSTFSLFVEECIQEGWVKLSSNPARHPAVLKLLPPPRTTTGHTVVYVPLENARQLVRCETVPLVRRVRYVVSFCAGLSAGEAAGLTWKHVAFDADVPHICIEQAYALKGADGWAEVRGPKRPSRVRKIPMHQAVEAALREWNEHGWEDMVGRPPAADDPVLASPSGGFTRPRLGEQTRRDLRRAGCSDKHDGHNITFQAVRRSFATFLHEVDVPETVRARLMGHSRRGVTDKHYTAVELTKLRDAIEKIDIEWSGRFEVLDAYPMCTPANDVVPARCAAAQDEMPGLAKAEAFHGAPGTIRTCDLRFRKPLLYPTELRGQRGAKCAE